MTLRQHKTPLPAQASEASVLEAGCDEAGRGCLAGPVVAAAVILPPNFVHPLLNDSKQLTEARREALRPVIIERALAWGIGIVECDEIDRINILRASILAMHRALDSLRETIIPDAISVDGNRFTSYRGIPHTTYVKGDARFANIAAASILAKTERDHIMMRLHDDYPQYGWGDNKGYPTEAHRAAIAAYGPTPHHRMSFRLIPEPTLFD